MSGANLFAVERSPEGRVAIIMRLNDSYLVSAFVRPREAQRIVCIALGDKIRKTVKQRAYQIKHGFTGGNYEQQIRALEKLNYMLGATPKWNFKVLPKYLNALLPHLRTIAPNQGKYAASWRNLIIGLELISQEKEIEAKLKSLLQS